MAVGTFFKVVFPSASEHLESLMPSSKKLDFGKITTAAIRTAKWATIMTKWRIGFESGGKRLGRGAKRSKRWQLVPFPGPNGRESAGIVDLLAIRRDHHTANKLVKRGDFFHLDPE